MANCPNSDPDREPLDRTPKGQFQRGVSGNRKGRPPKEALDHVAPNMDGWASAMTGIGTVERDKRLSHEFRGSCLSYLEIARLWEKDGLASKAIEAPTAEAFREGYQISIGEEDRFDDLTEQIEEKLEELGANKAIERAWQFKRAYGGGLILLGTKDSGRLSTPLDHDKVRGLEYLEVFEPIEMVPETFYRTLKNNGKPEFFRFNNVVPIGPESSKAKKDLTPSSLIHESRLIVFDGIKTSRYLQSTNQISPYWGASVVDRFIESLRDCGVGYEGAGLAATDSVQPVITIEGLMAMVAKNPEKVRDRFAAIEMGRSNARAIIIGEKDKFERQTTNLGGIPELLDRLSIFFSANIDIPLSVLFGYSPSSLGEPGKTEKDLWHNKIRGLQNNDLEPVLKKIIKMIVRSLRQRKLPKKIDIVWNELERLNDKDRAEAYLNQARSDSMYVKAGVLTPDEIRRNRFRRKYSYETTVKANVKAPGFMAPLPAGVVPGTTPAGGAPAGAKTGANAHSVTSYARRNPTGPALGANAKQGGDVTPTNRDGLTELEYQRQMLERAHEMGAEPGVIAFLEDMVDTCEIEEAGRALSEERSRDDDDGSGPLRMFNGFPVVIESPKGSTREWVDTDGTRGSTTMKYDYGYVRGSAGTDGDSVDVYLGPNEGTEWAYVVHQMSKASGFTVFDEDKVMLGFDSANHAKDAYLRQYDDERFYGGMSIMTVEDFRLKIFAHPGEKVTNDEAA